LWPRASPPAAAAMPSLLRCSPFRLCPLSALLLLLAAALAAAATAAAAAAAAPPTPPILAG